MDVLGRPAEEFGNIETVEKLWAVKALEHAELYFNLLCSVDPKYLRLTPMDETIYKAFREEFPDLDVRVIDENELKSPKSREKWRPFCERFKNCVEDYNYGTLLRTDATGDYVENNSIFVTRIQFYAIELARNYEGVNDCIRKKFAGQTNQSEIIS